MLVFVGMILLMPQTPALTISIAATLGYMVGASTWLLYAGFRHGHEMFCGLSLLTAAAIAVGVHWGWHAEPHSDAPLGVSPASRTSLGTDCGAFRRCDLHQSLAT